MNTVGNYRLRWTPVANANGDAGFWDEVVIGHIKITQNTGNRMPRITGESSDATAITVVEGTQKDEPVFDLNGRKVTTDRKGIVIKNGKKVLVR